ncbi:SCO6880 family protein [Amycolatopsis sp. NPDC051102]|uniref:SCO6880 family protein n=1 Tax=Amycolatopsis sp. NPDC051102 TaxID=3155163 RepID=UPI00341BCA77
MVRTYGAWRRRRGFEVMGLPAGHLAWLLSAVCLPMVIALFDSGAGLWAAIPGALVAIAVLVRSDGTPWVVLLARRWIWHRAYRRGMTSYRSELVTRVAGAPYLPGPLAPLELLAVRQITGAPAGWMWDRRGGYLTTQVRLGSTGTLLAEESAAEGWVAAFGAWQAALGYVPGIRSVAIVVDTAPSSISRVRDYVAEHAVDDAPDLARRLMADVLADLPEQTAEMHVWAAVTLDPRKLPTRPTTMVEATAEASVALTGIVEGLASGGVSVLGRATPGWTASRMRAAFDPAARGQVDRDQTGEAAVSWQQAGPQAATEQWDHLQHDSGWSVTYALRELPAARVRHDVLRRLMAPGAWPRRVALLYRPYPAELAASVVDAELQAAAVRRTAARKAKRDFSVREQVDAALATATAVEQARGAGLGEPSILVTVTTLAEADLPAACADLESRARGARLKLQRMYGAQLLGFASTLGVGVDPYELAARTPGRSR